MADIELAPFPFDGSDVRAVVTTRHGGASDGVYGGLNLGDHVGDDHARVAQNRKLVAEALAVDAVTLADQQHQSTCAVVDADLAGRGFSSNDEAKQYLPATDAMVSNVPGAALGIMVADCAPVVFWDPIHRAIGAAHSGRGGVIRGVLSSTVERMASQFGTDPNNLIVGIGPCIGFDSYEVGDAEAEALAKLLPGAALTKPSRPGHQFMDLGGAVERQLMDLGVPADQVHRMDIDTRTSTDTFFSDRAERPCGRFMAVIALPE